MRKDANWVAAAVSTETPLARADEAIERLPDRLLTSPIAVHELAVGAKLPIRDIRASVAMGGESGNLMLVLSLTGSGPR